TLVGRVECELDGNRGIGSDLSQNGLGARNEVSRSNNLVDEPNAISFLRADHFAGENEMQSAALADQTRQPLRSAAARKEPERDFRLTELGLLHGECDGARHRSLTA